MKINKNLRDVATKCIKDMQSLESLLSGVDSLQCDSELERKVKELMQKQIKTSIADVLIAIDTLSEVGLALEDGTGLLSVYTITFENFNGYKDESTF